MKTRSKLVPCAVACALLTACSGADTYGQAAAPVAVPRPPTAPRSTVLIDPAHGGTDPGSDLGNKVAEKTVTLALAIKLRGALAAQGFAVVLTRDSDASAALTADQRAEIADRSHALACVSLHSTRSGSGVHVYTSALQPTAATTDAEFAPKRWETLQQEFVGQSESLAEELKSSFSSAGLPADVKTASVPLLNSMMCPAVAIEFASVESLASADKNAVSTGYQDAVVKAMAAGLGKWRADSAPQPASPPTDVKGTP